MPGLERIDGGRRLLTGPGLMLFVADAPAATAAHAQPAWKLVVASDGELVVNVPGVAPEHCPGVLVPPGVRHAIAATGGHTALLVDPWVDPGFAADGPVPLQRRLVRRLVDDLMEAEPLEDLGAEVLARLHTGLDLHSRRPASSLVRAAAEQVGAAPTLGVLADEVGLSPSRLRERVRQELGVTLLHLRLWARLRQTAAGTGVPLAERAVTAGFSDQSHLTRTARRFVGRTPAALLASQRRRGHARLTSGTAPA